MIESSDKVCVENEEKVQKKKEKKKKQIKDLFERKLRQEKMLLN